jgi:hypothetical protein
VAQIVDHAEHSNDRQTRVAARPCETWNFQASHRDTNPTRTSNFTDAVAVIFQ